MEDGGVTARGVAERAKKNPEEKAGKNRLGGMFPTLGSTAPFERGNPGVNLHRSKGSNGGEG